MLANDFHASEVAPMLPRWSHSRVAPSNVQWAPVATALIWITLSSLPSQVQLGSVSLSAVLTLGGAFILLLAIPAVLHDRLGPASRLRRDAHPILPMPLGILAVLITASLLLHPSMSGLQNWAVYVAFIVTILSVGTLWRSMDIYRAFRHLRMVGACVASLSLLLEILSLPMYLPRPFAIEALVILAMVIPGKPENRLIRYAPYICVVAITLSLSRTATVIALVALVFVVLRGRSGVRFIRALFALLAVAGGGWLLVSRYPPLRERFLGGDAAVSYGGLSFNTSGRGNIWGLLEAKFFDGGPFGHGIGAAADLVSARYPDVAQPHNEYLRLLYDLGWPGLLMFVIGYVLLLIRCFKRAIQSDDSIHWSATIALGGTAAIAYTDNPFIYPFVMIPLAVVVGLSLSRPHQSRMAAASVSDSLTSPGRSSAGV